MKYFSACGCGFSNEKDLPLGISEKDIEKVVADFYNTPKANVKLLTKFYKETANTLLEGVKEGSGKDIFNIDLNKPDGAFLESLSNNTYFFSGAKTYTQLKDLNALLIQDGKRVPFSDFKKEAKTMLEDYNVNYLKTEYNLAIGNGRMATKWQEYEADKDILPYLQYRTAKDGRVRDEHQVLDGIVKKVGDPFWDSYYPLLGYGCRCSTIQLDEGSPTNTKEMNLPDIPKEFSANVGKEKIIFSPDHPYFKNVDKKDIPLAQRNFDLPIPKPNGKE